MERGVCVCVCVCEREREREKMIHASTHLIHPSADPLGIVVSDVLLRRSGHPVVML